MPDDEALHFDHIRAFADGGVSELDNIAPMCEVHNKAKGTLALQDFRVKLRLPDEGTLRWAGGLGSRSVVLTGDPDVHDGDVIEKQQAAPAGSMRDDPTPKYRRAVRLLPPVRTA